MNRLAPHLDGMPKAKVTDSTEKLIALKMDLEKELANLELELTEKAASLTVELIALPLTIIQRQIMIRRYVDCGDWSEIIPRLNFSSSQIFYQHRQALKLLGLTGRRGRLAAM